MARYYKQYHIYSNSWASYLSYS